ncbi:hypothetical protein ACI6Q2_18465 [Chitinophagaceae bacterium LWZ2-11]
MKKSILIIFLCAIGFVSASHAQSIVYSEPDRDDARNMDYDIMGKMNGNFLIYKNYRGTYYITVYDNDMKAVDKIKLDYLPDRILSSSFLQYPDYFYMFYQYQKRNTVYAMAVKIDGTGKKIGNPVQLDTTDINYNTNSKIYTFLNSDDKQRLLVFKINSKNEKLHYLTTSLFDKNLNLDKKALIGIPMSEKNEFLTEFQLGNDGDLVCIKASGSNQNDNITKISLMSKPALSDSVYFSDIKMPNIFLDDIRIKIDNVNNHYLVASFFSKQKRGNVDGLYCYLWDKQQQAPILNLAAPFSDELRAEAKGESNTKTAFNDYFLRNIVMKKDGGFVFAAESVYTSSRGSNYNRWDYFGNPYYGVGGFNSYYSSPYGGGYYPWDRYNNSFYNITRYYADNIVMLSFDVTGKPEWSNIIRKSQYDDNSDNFIGYGVLNSGSQIHFLFNVQEKRQTILTDQVITPEGEIVRTPTLKNLDRGYDFMPRHSKQTGSRQIIIPCEYRNYVCFAKIDY